MSTACGECEHFDVVVRSGKETDWGWCAKFSVYPFKEGPGQVFPRGVKRVSDPAEPAKPRMVKRLQVVENCPKFAAKKVKPSKKDLIAKLQTKGEKRILE